MKVQIWSDVQCPFCYIGKRRFEEALSSFEHSSEIEIEWKSFLLNPTLKTDPTISVYQSLSDSKGWQMDYARQVTDQVTEMAAQVGLTYNFDRAVVANSFNAHRLSHLAKKYDKGDALEEQLFKAYFTEGKNIDDAEMLTEIGLSVGLDEAEVKQTLATNAYSDDVHRDVYEAQTLNIRGVPFFVVDNQYAVSGAQPTEVFLNTLQTAYTGFKKRSIQLNVTDGPSCEPGGDC
ncbi:DsbA family oxidoreductase [Mucilaginibacter sp. CSA2-8R]|uniref:DsbA family oxidoreductase n=1 Tax=Mucilaginibacter sp. CSA2-8R TaxID=3141542 RepID=UPI00315D4884